MEAHLSCLSVPLRDEVWISLTDEIIANDAESINDPDRKDYSVYCEGIASEVRIREAQVDCNRQSSRLVERSGCDKIFEILQPAVRMFLAEPASSAVAERGFSNAGFSAEGRPRMTEEVLDDLAVVRHQLQALRESGMPEAKQRKLTEDKLTELVNDIRKRFDPKPALQISK